MEVHSLWLRVLRVRVRALVRVRVKVRVRLRVRVLTLVMVRVRVLRVRNVDWVRVLSVSVKVLTWVRMGVMKLDWVRVKLNWVRVKLDWVGEGVEGQKAVLDADLSDGQDEDDFSYISSAGEEYSDDELDTTELVLEDDEYLVVRQRLKDRNEKDICDAILEGGGGECEFSDYEDFDVDICSSLTDEDNEVARISDRHMRIVYDPRCDHKQLQITVGMRFVDGYQTRDVLTTNAIENGWKIHLKRTMRHQVEARSTYPCNWRCYDSEVKKSGTFLIKVVEWQHTWPWIMRNTLVTVKWIAQKHLNVFRVRPETNIKELGRDIAECS